MIKTEYLDHEVFICQLKKTHTKDEEVTEKIYRGFLRAPILKTSIKTIQYYELDQELLLTFPVDVVEKINKVVKDDGGVELGFKSWGFRDWYYYESKNFIRDFTITLNEFCQKHNIGKDNLIKMEYCKSGCNITGAYITWDD